MIHEELTTDLYILDCLKETEESFLSSSIDSKFYLSASVINPIALRTAKTP